MRFRHSSLCLALYVDPLSAALQPAQFRVAPGQPCTAWGRRILYWEWDEFLGITDVKSFLISFDGQIGYKSAEFDKFSITPSVSAGPLFGIGYLSDLNFGTPIILFSPWETLELSYGL